MAGLPPFGGEGLARAASQFAVGQSPGVSPTAATLAQGVLNTMRTSKLKIAFSALLAVCLGMAGGAWALRAAPPAPPAAPRLFAAEPAPRGPAKPAEEKPAPKAEEKPPRLLLFAAGPTREYQFLRTLFAARADGRRAELSLCLQGGARANIVQDVPPERMLPQFPSRLEEKEDKADPEARFDNLLSYDVVIALDPDWTKVPKESLRQLEKWVGVHGGGLIVVAGPVHTLDLARPVAIKDDLKPLLDLLPVVLKDFRIDDEEAVTDRPNPLSFPGAAAAKGLLQLDPAGKYPLAGWQEFFYGEARADWQTTNDWPQRGFFSCYPVENVKPKATVLAQVRYPKGPGPRAEKRAPRKARPFLVTAPYGKGRVVYLGSGELWRLRQYDEAFHERLWTQLVRHAAGRQPPAEDPRGGRREPSREERRAVEKGLAWLAEQQHRDGHWECADESLPVAMTAMAGLALLAEGSTIREGQYAQNLRRAADWLMARAQPNGLIGNTAPDAEGGRLLPSHAFAVTFLASVYGEEEDAERRKKLEGQLNRAVRFLCEAQTTGGGWGRLPAKDGAGDASVSATIYHLLALRAARLVGLPVPQKVLAAGQAYLAKTVEPATPEAMAALGALGPLSDHLPLARKWLKDYHQLLPVVGEDTLDEFYGVCHARVVFTLGDAGYAKLFPESQPEDLLTWSALRKKLFNRLIEQQEVDGSWRQRVDPVCATAVRLMILQLETAAGPVAVSGR
jgi:hypothetical protein